jgi:hypothetical protein
MPLLIETPAHRLQSMAIVEDPPMDRSTSEHRAGAYPATTRVEIRSTYDGSWGKGFEVAEVTDGGYRIRRASDGSVLPTEFEPDEVRKERRRDNWWI